MKPDVRQWLYHRLRARYEARVQSLRNRMKTADAGKEGAETRMAAVVTALSAPAAEDFPCTVSIIIPSRDNPDMLSRCLDSLCRTLQPEAERISPEVILVDNGSNTENRSKINDILESTKQGGIPCRYLYREEDFSFSRMCNRGAAEAKGALLLFLNDDVEALSAGWLSEMAAYALTEGTGAVGAKLLYPGEEQRIQHCGIVNMRIGPVHVLNGMPDKETRADGFHRENVEVIAVTGACLMLRKALFTEVGGFREELPVAFNDVDLCYTLFEKGYRNVCLNRIALTHHESFSRGDDTKDIRKTMRLTREFRILMEAHRGLIGVDPYRRDVLLKEADLLAESSAREEGAPVLTPVAAGKALPADAAEDAAHFVSVEYANRLMLALTRAEVEALTNPDSLTDYYVRGYSFVIGADNALYRRQVMLQKIYVADDGAVTPKGEVLCFDTEDAFRPDIEERIPDQTNCAMTGFHILIPRGVLKDGLYRIGVLACRRYSRQKLYQWGKTVLYVNDG